MNNTKFSDLVRNFLISEEREQPTLKSRLLTLEEMLGAIFGKNVSESRRLEVVREQIRAIKRDVKRLEEENKNLHEQILVLQESKRE